MWIHVPHKGWMRRIDDGEWVECKSYDVAEQVNSMLSIVDWSEVDRRPDAVPELEVHYTDSSVIDIKLWMGSGVM